MAEQLRVSKVGSYVEELGRSLSVTKVGAYVEIDTGALRVTKVGAYVEVEQNGLYVSKVGAYVEIATPDRIGILKEMLDIIYNGSSLRDYIQSFALTANVKLLGGDSFATKRETPGLSSWEVSFSGLWDKSLDDILGDEVVSRGTSSTKYDCQVRLGRWGHQVGYDWFDEAFVKSYITRPVLDEFIRFEAIIACSGVPSRGSR